MKSKNYIKGFLEDIVLQLIRKNDKMYGYEISQKVKEITAGEINLTEGALYPVLHRLESQNLLIVTYKKVDGRVRKYYELTPEGGESIKNNVVELQAFLAGLNSLFNLKPI
tara:strand:+ start:45 stop:377 length:333 start_codon:yes stop_codon:yes gene_type:complete